jgi:hypothetical protein
MAGNSTPDSKHGLRKKFKLKWLGVSRSLRNKPSFLITKVSGKLKQVKVSSILMIPKSKAN